MELFVDDAFAGGGHNGKFAESDLAVTAVELRHNAFSTLGVTGDDRHAGGKIQSFKVVEDGIFHAAGILIAAAKSGV